MSTFQKATRKRVWLKLAITGPPGSGKTKSALRLATGLASRYEGGKVCLLDTENESASLYADEFDFATSVISPRPTLTRSSSSA